MKVLVVSGEGAVFRMVAEELHGALAGAADAELAVETGAVASPWAVLRQRLKRSGLVRGLDEFAFKVYDLLVLRRDEEARARNRPAPAAPAAAIPGLNTPEGLAFLRAGAWDVVVCIATSIIGREALAIPRRGFVNIHPGVLPAYRGTGNLWAVCRGDWDHVGWTVHWMNERIDAGRLVARGRIAPLPGSLWALHVAALRAGAAEVARLVRAGTLLATEVDAAGERTAYQGWYGFGDYRRFRRRLKERPRGV